MPGLTVIVACSDTGRLRSALEIAAANAALGQRARLFLQGEAASMLGEGRLGSEGSRAGQPSLEELIEESRALGVRILVCQSGLALCGLSAAELPDGVETSGLVELLSSLDGDQLVIA